MKQTLVSYLVPKFLMKFDLKQVLEYLLGDSYEVVCTLDKDIAPELLSELEQILVKYARKDMAPNYGFHRKLMKAGIIKDFDEVIISCLVNPQYRDALWDALGGVGLINNIHSPVSVTIPPYSIKSRIAEFFKPVGF